jgi:hypothetical protein
MKPYLDSVDTYYSIKHEVNTKKDYAGIGAVIFTFTVMSIFIALSIYTALQITYGQEVNSTREGEIWDCYMTLTEGGILSGNQFADIFRFCKNGQGMPQIESVLCSTTLQGGTIIIDLTCKGNTIALNHYLALGYMIVTQTTTEIQLQPTTDTIEILKEKGINLNYTFTPP